MAEAVTLVGRIGVLLIAAAGLSASAGDLPRDALSPPGRLEIAENVESACEAVVAAVIETPGVSVSRDDGSFEEGPASLKLHGCRVLVTGSFAALRGAPDVPARLRNGLESAGWREITAYAADGKDGTAFAFERGEIRCFAVGRWNGGADGEREIPREDWYEVSVGCTNEASGSKE